MNARSLVYPIAILALVGAYIIGFSLLTAFDSEKRYRLPRYYSPGGSILALGHDRSTQIDGARRFLEIDGLDPAAQQALYSDADAIFVRTDIGPGMMRLVVDSPFQVAYDFKFFIAFSFIYLVCAIWFLKSANDIHLAALCAVLCAFNFALIQMMAYHRLDLLYQISGLLLAPVILNMGLRTTGKEISGYLLAAELLAVLFLALIAYVGQSSAETIRSLARLILFTLLITLAFVAALQLENAISSTEERLERRKRWTLFLGTLLGFFVPFGLILLELRGGSSPIPLEYGLGAGLIFPVALIYGTYRLQIVPFQFVLTHSIVAALLTILLTGVYGAVLLAHSILLPEQDEAYQWIVSLIFVLLLVFFLDPARRLLTGFVDRRMFRLDTRLSESLKHLAEMISTHGRLQPAANAFLNEVQNTLRLEKLSFLLSAAGLDDFNLRQEKLLRLPEHSPHWRVLQPERMVVTAYLTYAAGKREELYQYLYKHKFVLGIGVAGDEDDGVRAALLVGYRRNGTKLELREIRYLQEAAKLAGMLIHNYSVLMQEVHKRHRRREVGLACNAQRSIQVADTERYPDIRIAHSNRPAISVSGDYLDLIPISRNRFALFFGDVSGHGLGTGFIASSLRALTRANLESGARLLDTIEVMNSFLNDRYQGNEYITLFAFELNCETGVMRFINAGHPAPFLYRATAPEGGEPGRYLNEPHLGIDRRGHFAHIERLESNAHMIGILPTPFELVETRLSEGDRLYLFSDGVTETFNERDEVFGMRSFEVFLDRHQDTPAMQIPAQLEATLRSFRDGRPQSDDASFLVLEYHRGGGVIRGVLDFLGLAGESDQRDAT